MRTYEYIVYPGTEKATRLMFQASNRAEADVLCKAYTKRNAKVEFVKTHSKEALQEIPSCDPASREYLFIYTCPECGYEWTQQSNCSHSMQMRCQNEYVEHKLDKAKHVTYSRMYSRAA